MIPVIALVGRPNVGKSTLFNSLTKSRDALVANFPGLTRDRQYGQAVFENKPFVVVDTGGIGVEEQAVDDLMAKQSNIAIEEADIIFFLVDAKSGLTPLDEEIAMKLRSYGNKVYLIVNKIDGASPDIAASEFQQLGLTQQFAIAAAHGRGVKQMIASVLSQPDLSAAGDKISQEGISIAFIGRPNVGKSTMINRIMGEERVVVYDLPGTTRDSVTIPFERQGEKYQLIDTAGVRRRGRIKETVEKFSIIKTLQAIKQSNVCILVVDAREGLSDQDLHLLGHALEAGRALVIAINKWDGLSDYQKDSIKTEISRRLQFAKFITLRFTSALHGTGVGDLFKDIKLAYDSAMKQFSTPQLTRLLQDFVEQHAPPLSNNRRVKLRYAHAGGHNPPIIVIHGSQTKALSDSYKRYLMKMFIKHLKLEGTPLRIELKDGENPYKNKKNKLTGRQIKKKQCRARFNKKSK